MTSLVNILKERLASSDEARNVLDQLKQRGVLVARAIDADKLLSDEDKESLAVVLGGVAVMAETIEASMELTGSGIELERRGLLKTATETIARIDQVLAS